MFDVGSYSLDCKMLRIGVELPLDSIAQSILYRQIRCW